MTLQVSNMEKRTGVWNADRPNRQPLDARTGPGEAAERPARCPSLSQATPGHRADGHAFHRSLPGVRRPARTRREGGSPARRGAGPASCPPDPSRLRKRRKDPASPSPDWLLVEEVRGLPAVTVGELATRLGPRHSTVLGKADKKPLSGRVRAQLLALKSEHPAAKP